ncbi:MAG TPA: carboxymuconolactone decarboxylase family protein, partial [Flavisolibacter sp.]|nr:carboxymuconolactone decarboxylase family protein [Flavisolibacter sp.]
MKPVFLTITIAVFSLLNATAQVPNKQSSQTHADTSRAERTEKKYQELFGQQILASKTDPELMNILQRLIFGDVFYTGNLDDKTRELITITALTANQTLPQLKVHTNAALNIGVSPVEIR